MRIVGGSRLSDISRRASLSMRFDSERVRAVSFGCKFDHTVMVLSSNEKENANIRTFARTLMISPIPKMFRFWISAGRKDVLLRAILDLKNQWSELSWILGVGFLSSVPAECMEVTTTRFIGLRCGRYVRALGA